MNYPNLLAELGALANLFCGTNKLTVVAGKPGSGWSIDLLTGVISADSLDLELRHPDFCRGLICHEIGHHLLTRSHLLFPKEDRSPAHHALLNVLEDVRLENYISKKFPGVSPWIKMFNDELIQVSSPDIAERLADDAVGSFLHGVIHRVWSGTVPEGFHPDGKAAVEEVWPSVERILNLHPPIEAPLDATPWEAAYKATDLPLIFSAEDAVSPPDAMEMAVRLAQLSVWQETFTHILPVYNRLLARHPFKERMDFGGILVIIGPDGRKIAQIPPGQIHSLDDL
ncbi:MAG: hypothetical protein ACKO2G_10890, partial [Verrucomicrobiales bacterium]